MQVPYARLRDKWEDFDYRVRRFLVQTFGRLADYPWWNPWLDRWLRGTLALADERATAASMHYFASCGDAFNRIAAIEV